MDSQLRCGETDPIIGLLGGTRVEDSRDGRIVVLRLPTTMENCTSLLKSCRYRPETVLIALRVD